MKVGSWLVSTVSLGMGCGVLLGSLLMPSTVHAEPGVLFINEVMAENDSQEPVDIAGGHPDMVEIYNASGEEITLGTLSTETSYYLSDAVVLDPATATFREPRGPEDFDPMTASRFPTDSKISPEGFFVVFCDGSTVQRLCEPHMAFSIDNNGSEPLTLWGPEDAEGNRSVVDQVWLPPLGSDVSFGRFPDGSGPAPVPLEQTFDVFHFNPRHTSTFAGGCTEFPPACESWPHRRSCEGAPNGLGGNLAPRANRESTSTNHPRGGESVELVVRVTDGEDPTADNIARVEVRYSVNGVEQQPVSLVQSSDVLDGSERVPPRPLERWTLWSGSIPGQPVGSHVAFEFYVEDYEGASSRSPRDLCLPGVGPCDSRGEPGPGCVKEHNDVGEEGLQFERCVKRRQYLAGYAPPEPFDGLLINEIVAVQDGILEDTTPRAPCDPLNLQDQSCKYEDYFELCNGSDQSLDLSSVWLSDRPFQPQSWKFPDGSTIEPGERLIIWCDNDGGKCPRFDEAVQGDGQECPDPTAPELNKFHTNFNLEATGDQLYLFKEEGDGFGVLHGVEFGLQERNVALSLTPDCTRSGSYRPHFGGSPGRENPAVDPPPDTVTFLRGDANSDCVVNISDATFTLNHLFQGGPLPCPDAADANDLHGLDLSDTISILNYLFLGGPEPSAPGPNFPGPDPTPDELADCVDRGCE